MLIGKNIIMLVSLSPVMLILSVAFFLSLYQQLNSDIYIKGIQK